MDIIMTKKQNAATSTDRASNLWAISGTKITGLTKEELKAQRRELNAAAGTPEVDTKDKAAVSSNNWVHHITKAYGHPNYKG